MTAYDLQPVQFQPRHKGAVVSGILQLHHLMYGDVQMGKLLLGRHARNIRLLVFCVYHVLQGSHTDHKKFIQVGGRDAQKLQPLKQGNVLVPGLVQHSAVEQNPAQFPVGIIFRIIKINFTHNYPHFPLKFFSLLQHRLHTEYFLEEVTV